MLVLARKRDQRIRISGPCEIVVVEIRGDKVRLGVDAEKEVNIVRVEVDDGRAADK